MIHDGPFADERAIIGELRGPFRFGTAPSVTTKSATLYNVQLLHAITKYSDKGGKVREKFGDFEWKKIFISNSR